MNTDTILVTIIGEKIKMYSSNKNELMKIHFWYFFHKCGAIGTQKKVKHQWSRSTSNTWNISVYTQTSTVMSDEGEGVGNSIKRLLTTLIVQSVRKWSLKAQKSLTLIIIIFLRNKYIYVEDVNELKFSWNIYVITHTN